MDDNMGNGKKQMNSNNNNTNSGQQQQLRRLQQGQQRAGTPYDNDDLMEQSDGRVWDLFLPSVLNINNNNEWQL